LRGVDRLSICDSSDNVGLKKRAIHFDDNPNISCDYLKCYCVDGFRYLAHLALLASSPVLPNFAILPNLTAVRDNPIGMLEIALKAGFPKMGLTM